MMSSGTSIVSSASKAPTMVKEMPMIIVGRSVEKRLQTSST